MHVHSTYSVLHRSWSSTEKILKMPHGCKGHMAPSVAAPALAPQTQHFSESDVMAVVEPIDNKLAAALIQSPLATDHHHVVSKGLSGPHEAFAQVVHISRAICSCEGCTELQTSAYTNRVDYMGRLSMRNLFNRCLNMP